MCSVRLPLFETNKIVPQQYHEDEAESALLSQGPFSTPFDEGDSRTHTPPSLEHKSSYTLTESYRGDAASNAPPYNVPYDQGPTEYMGGHLADPTASFGVPGGRPYSRTESNSSEAWQRRQVPNAGGLKRYATRKVKLVHGSVLSVDYPVPSAIQNSVQAKYRNDLERGSEEFTHMRCRRYL